MAALEVIELGLEHLELLRQLELRLAHGFELGVARLQQRLQLSDELSRPVGLNAVSAANKVGQLLVDRLALRPRLVRARVVLGRDWPAGCALEVGRDLDPTSVELTSAFSPWWPRRLGSLASRLQLSERSSFLLQTFCEERNVKARRALLAPLLAGTIRQILCNFQQFSDFSILGDKSLVPILGARCRC